MSISKVTKLPQQLCQYWQTYQVPYVFIYWSIDYSITLFSLVKHKFLNVLFCTSSANQHRAQFFSFSSRVWKIYFFCIFLHFNPKIITERSQEENQLEETVLLMKFFFFFSPTRTTTTFSSRTPLFVLTFSLRIPKTQKNNRITQRASV